MIFFSLKPKGFVLESCKTYYLLVCRYRLYFMSDTIVQKTKSIDFYNLEKNFEKLP